MDANRSRITRRRLLKASAAAVAAPYVLTSTVPAAPPASERITLGIIGCGNINTYHMRSFVARKDAQIVAVCDPFVSRRRRFQQHVNAAAGGAGKKVCRDYRDFRDLLARSDVDAVCIATPDHWHAAHGIAAMKAGKDVYGEKPLSHTVYEGQRMVETARTYQRIFQNGLQRRSHGNVRHACELVRNGRIGKLRSVKVGIIGLNAGIRVGVNFPVTPPPGDLDYDLWLGPAAVKPFCRERVNLGTGIYWYYVSDYTVGFISGNGVHFVDVAQWGIGDGIPPVEVHTTLADIPADGLIDDAIRWRTEVVYANGVRMSYSDRNNPHASGIRFEGTEGWIHVDGSGRLTAQPLSVLKSVIGPGEIHLYRSPGPHRNFLDCIRTRRRPAADPVIAHSAATTCNLAEISARLGRKIKWDPARQRCLGDEAANRLLGRAQRPPWTV